MGRWSPTVVAEAPRNAGMGVATFGQAAMESFSALEALRDRRRQRELQEEENEAQERYRQGSLANDATRLGIMREEADWKRKNDAADFQLKVAQAGGEIAEEAGEHNAQPGSTVSNAQAGQQESDLQRIMREASEVYPTTPSTVTDPNSGRTYRIDANRAARAKFIEERTKALTEAQKAKDAHARALEVQALRNKGQLEAARVRGRSRGTGGGAGGGGDKIGGVTDTQMRSGINAMQKDFGRISAARNDPRMNPDSDSYDETGSIRNKYVADSTATVDRYRPENNPTMAAAFQRYGMPQGASAFFDTDAVPEGDVQRQMGALTRARDRAKNPQDRAKAQRLLNEYAQQINQRGMQR